MKKIQIIIVIALLVVTALVSYNAGKRSNAFKIVNIESVDEMLPEEWYNDFDIIIEQGGKIHQYIYDIETRQLTEYASFKKKKH